MADMQPEKLHAACDECRTRKLKCSGDTPACIRCVRESIGCVYSPQKPMGRPRKRRRDDVPLEDTAELQTEPSPTVNGFSMQPLGNGGLASQTDLSVDFPGFADLSTGSAFSSSSMSPAYLETFGQAAAQDFSFVLDSMDPSLWNATPYDSGHGSHEIETGPCSCLSLMYLTLTDLQAPNNFSFPAVIPRLRHALTAASTMIHCPKCPTEVFTSIQNMQTLNALLCAIAERFHKVLAEIDAEAARLEQSGEKKSYRVGDNSPENAHLHTGDLSCPMGYDIKLDAQDWRKLAKQMLKTEIEGGGHNPTPLLGLVEDLEKRQERWHCDKSMHTEERTRLFGEEHTCRSNGNDAMCLKMVRHIRRMVEQMNWD